ncbi:MAG: Holliday junction resolvase RuvX [Jaaginema sp. PMC 1079.18]|nr:Holliday junction resolvase RuvX [Jaaginema sp. PMC 1080.18]MEC4852590.1 Holliday junction resolvase RuvX [Jaaginema sp. PMC 1079.18]MEC4868344.1 Holliday junction resolvase RuvX [Jaaginema sp. PMC 1078.18]
MQRIAALGLDIGSKRIGVAGCDGLGLLATEITTIQRRSFPQDIETLGQIVQEREVEILVVGLPYSFDGTLGKQARTIQKLAKRYSNALNLPVEYVNEQLTSFAAEEALKAQNIAPSRHKALIDRKAAAIILQQWLDERRS